jgi:Xaa-Pro aminopeptidase
MVHCGRDSSKVIGRGSFTMGLDGKFEIFRRRRERFLNAIGEGAVAIIPAAPVAIRSNDVEFPYRQDNNFYYLTGFKEPESALLLAPGHPDGEFVMFVAARDRARETWIGRRVGVEGAIADYGADRAYPIGEFEQNAARYVETAERLYYPLGLDEKMNQRVLELFRRSNAIRPRTGAGPVTIADPREILHEARLKKEPEELELMRRAAAISTPAHIRAMREARGGMMEWEIEALIDYTFRRQGATGPSYPSIVASGPNAAVLHHTANDRELLDGELLLIDAGCEYEFYASDVTRTFAVGARFSPLQRDMYAIVLEAQLNAIAVVRPGARIDQPHEAARKVLVDGMRQLGLVQGSADEIIANASYSRYFMHRTSHWLGMDVHDVGMYRVRGEPRTLEPGMVLTVEPGLYVAADDEEAPERFRGIGIRIEDDVLVTESGHEVLTAAVPKKIADIEALTAPAGERSAQHPTA